MKIHAPLIYDLDILQQNFPISLLLNMCEIKSISEIWKEWQIGEQRVGATNLKFNKGDSENIPQPAIEDNIIGR